MLDQISACRILTQDCATKIREGVGGVWETRMWGCAVVLGYWGVKGSGTPVWNTYQRSRCCCSVHGCWVEGEDVPEGGGLGGPVKYFT